MARPQKIGLDYFPLDTKPDIKMKAVIRKYGALGLGCIIGLYQSIYDNGYYIKISESFIEDFCLEYNIDDEDYLRIFIKFCVKRELFNKGFYDSNKILTSTGIQKRFIEATKRRKCKQMSSFILINEDGNLVNVCNNLIDEDISTQSKEKESKEKESKEKIKTTINHLNQLTSKSYRTSGNLSARFDEGYTLEDALKVIDNKIGWMGGDYAKYLTPKTLFCKKHFDAYLNQDPEVTETKSNKVTHEQRQRNLSLGI